MSRIEWLILFLVFVAYVLLGGLVFQEIHNESEDVKKETLINERKLIHELVTQELLDGSQAREDVLMKLADYCGKPLLFISNKTSFVSDDEQHYWNFYNSFFVAITVVSTIGYGNLAPSTTGSRMFCIAYALIGIPLNGILLAGLGEYFSRTFLRAHHRYREAPEVESRFSLLIKVAQYLAAGICIFILLPAVVFAVAEEWTYDEAVYYAFITLSTIGFGDYVAGYMTSYEKWRHSPGLLATYRTFIVLWIVFGLGYLAMILSFITRAMRSSRIRRIEQKVAKRFKSTHARLWHGASRDLRYLRRILNELYMLKFKVRLQQHNRRFVGDACHNRTPVDANHRFTTSHVERQKLDCSANPQLIALPSPVDSVSLLPYLEAVLFNNNDLWYTPQPVYRESLATIPWRGRCSSLPSLLPSSQEDKVPADKVIRRIMSESCLDMFDRGATFAAAPLRMDTTELLTTVVDAIAASESGDMELGYHGFSDADILESEENPIFVPDSSPPHSRRSRTSSIATSVRSLAHTIRSRSKSRTASVASDAEWASRSRGSGSTVSLRRALALRSAAAAMAAVSDDDPAAGPKPFEISMQERWPRRRSEGTVLMPQRTRAASVIPIRHQDMTHSQVTSSNIGDILMALHSLHSRCGSITSDLNKDPVPSSHPSDSRHDINLESPRRHSLRNFSSSVSPRHSSISEEVTRPPTASQHRLHRGGGGGIENGVGSGRTNYGIIEERPRLQSSDSMFIENEKQSEKYCADDLESVTSITISRL